VDLILDDPSLGNGFVELARRSVVGDYWARTISVYENLSLGTNA
jgi:hypothetical protein